MIYCVLQQNVEVVPFWKMWIRESKNVIVYNFVKKYTRFIFFVSIFCFICNSDFYKDLQFAFGVELKK